MIRPSLRLCSLFVLLGITGLTDPDCTLEKICRSGYTGTVRPSSSYTSALKKKQMLAQKLQGEPGEYEEDHIIPLELCGHPTDPRNLMPERWDRARKKDVLETRFHKAVCAGQMSLQEAQKQIVTYE